ncbi:MAG: rhodanese-like domain-containing protein, partial [Chloroflexi bacterium]|nr:rhodanese-like domain-containing protein [Chloroflexota bacterium]
LQLVDVREPGDWASGHVPGAINLPLRDLQRSLGALDRARPVAFVCNSGFTSGIAASLAKGLGFVQVFNVSGGTSAWRRAGLEVETASATGR